MMMMHDEGFRTVSHTTSAADLQVRTRFQLVHRCKSARRRNTERKTKLCEQRLEEKERKKKKKRKKYFPFG